MAESNATGAAGANESPQSVQAAQQIAGATAFYEMLAGVAALKMDDMVQYSDDSTTVWEDFSPALALVAGALQKLGVPASEGLTGFAKAAARWIADNIHGGLPDLHAPADDAAETIDYCYPEVCTSNS